MLTTSRRLFVLDRYRIPYELADRSGSTGVGRLRSSDGSGAELIWAEPSSAPRAYSFLGMPFVGALASTNDLQGALAGRKWTRDITILGADGSIAGWVLRAEDGSTFLPFDPDELIWGTLAERYTQVVSGQLTDRARRAYYTIRDRLPRGLQLAIRRRYTLFQNRKPFPGWPCETRLHEIFGWLFDAVERVAGEPVPWIAPWPDGATWALVLTHDVEHAEGYNFIDEVAAVEQEIGVRSAWYFVPERDYSVSDQRLRSLAEAGFEIGLHGLRHDGRDLDPLTFTQRLPAMRAYASRWGAVGFRSPSTLRNWEVMPRLGLEYDSSYADTARYEPIAGGSCTWLPFFIGDTVELPMTLPMDHTLFELLGERDETRWIEKAEFLREVGGMALLLSHPDYLRTADRLKAYRRFLERMVGDPTVWIALPRDVAAWWRHRYTSLPVQSEEGWQVEGDTAKRATIVVGRSPEAHLRDR